VQQSIDIVCPLGPQQQTRSSGVWRSDGTDARKFHRPCSGSRVVSVLDSGAEGLGSNGSRVTVLGKLLTPVHQPAKLVAALLRVADVTAGLAESNGSLPPGL